MGSHWPMGPGRPGAGRAAGELVPSGIQTQWLWGSRWGSVSQRLFPGLSCVSCTDTATRYWVGPVLAPSAFSLLLPVPQLIFGVGLILGPAG